MSGDAVTSRPALTTYSEDEQMLIDNVAAFGREVTNINRLVDTLYDRQLCGN
jgi:hypothetical protein